MTIEKNRGKITAAIWQAMAQSGVDLSGVPREQQEKLVGAIADTLLVTVDGMLGEIIEPLPAPEIDDGLDEKVLWEGRPFLSLVESYLITSERIKRVKGLIGREIENFELIRIQDLDLSQNVSERLLRLGDISVQGQDPSNPQLILRNIPNPEGVYEILRKAWLEARKRHGLQFREFM